MMSIAHTASTATKKRKAIPDPAENVHLVQVVVQPEQDWDQHHSVLHVIRVCGDKLLESFGKGKKTRWNNVSGGKPILYCFCDWRREYLAHALFFNGLDNRQEYIGLNATDLAKKWEDNGDAEQLVEFYGKKWLNDEDAARLSGWWEEVEWVKHSVVTLTSDDLAGVSTIQNVTIFD